MVKSIEEWRIFQAAIDTGAPQDPALERRFQPVDALQIWALQKKLRWFSYGKLWKTIGKWWFNGI